MCVCVCVCVCVCTRTSYCNFIIDNFCLQGCAGVYLICWWFGTEFLQTKPAFGVRVKSIADTTFAGGTLQ